MQDATRLTPAEALFLLKPNRTNGLRTIRVTLLSLLVKAILRIEEQSEPGLFRDRKIPYLRLVPDTTPPAPPHVEAVIALVRGAQIEGGAISDVVKRATKEFGAGCSLYNTRYIVPALIGRGLIFERRIAFVRTYHATPAGDAERWRIEDEIDRARQLPKLLKTNPAEAASLALALGGTLLLVDDLRKHYKQLADAMRPAPGGDGDGGTFDTGGFPGGFDFGSFDLGSFDASAFDALDSAAGSFESGFSDGGGGDSSSGGDGGSD